MEGGNEQHVDQLQPEHNENGGSQQSEHRNLADQTDLNTEASTVSQRRASRANRQFTIPPKEALDLSGITKRMVTATEVQESLELQASPRFTQEVQNEFQRLSPNLLRLSDTNLTSGIKKSKGNVLQASIEFGIAGVSLIPTPPPPPPPPEISKSQRALSRIHGLFSSSSDSIPTTNSTSTPTPPASPPSEGFFRKLTTRLTSSPQLITPLHHNFHAEINSLLPPPIAPASTASNLTKIVHEIIATEWEYLGDLLALSDIKNMMLTHEVVAQADAMRIFGNVEQILMANLELYRTFQKKEWDCKQSFEVADLDVLAASISEAFVAIAAYLRMYAAYSSKHEDSLKVISTLSMKTDFKVFLLQLAKQPVCKGLALPGLLIKPIQRVCKYPLLLRELLKYIDSPVARPQIEMAMAKIEETLLKVNEHQKIADRVERMAKVLQELLDGGIDVESLNLATRRLISQGPLHTMLGGKKTKDGHYYLFHDLFLWTRRGLGSLKLEATIPLREALVIDINPPIPGEHGFEMVHAGQKKWQFVVDKPEEMAPLRKILVETIENAYGDILIAK